MPHIRPFALPDASLAAGVIALGLLPATVLAGGWGTHSGGGCDAGLVEEGGVCCWPGQGSDGSGCFGDPSCPTNLTAVGERCVSAAEGAEMLRLAEAFSFWPSADLNLKHGGVQSTFMVQQKSCILGVSVKHHWAGAHPECRKQSEPWLDFLFAGSFPISDLVEVDRDATPFSGDFMTLKTAASTFGHSNPINVFGGTPVGGAEFGRQFCLEPGGRALPVRVEKPYTKPHVPSVPRLKEYLETQTTKCDLDGDGESETATVGDCMDRGIALCRAADALRSPQ